MSTNAATMTPRQLAHRERVLALVSAFPHQPDAARIPPAVVNALIGRSSPTRWRYIADGRLPKPGSDGSYSAGELRSALARLASPR